MRLDGIRLCVPQVEDAVADYARLLGVAAVALDDGGWRLGLERGAVEIAPAAAAHLAVLFAAEDGDDLATWPVDAAEHGIDVRVVWRGAAPPLPAGAVRAIDHVVVHTNDPQRAITHWRDRLGLRLALDRTFAERGLRLLFFRSGGVTLEYAQRLGAPAEPVPDTIYGVSYRVADLEATQARLLEAGLDVSELRPGMKPGTRVATVRSGTAGVPTLLIEQPGRD